ncbi:MAG TPA: ABC transporter permease [Syntrophales bacterium]|nr:ABC transporter permease [Syntrophales bacterium]HOD98024.1 ABC transporter permease [Syntrophales bacterium]HOH73742.1 ABC transporter permease [Syntrophales bacterium]HPN09611.1 ABC transporter permease [Syntrophales bacterium]HPX80839.1 ABC transporter permease [Syntrophales bacterium]
MKSNGMAGQKVTSFLPAGFLLVVMLPLMILPLAAVFIYALQEGPKTFMAALATRDALFALRFSVIIAFATAAVNVVLGTYAAYVLSKTRFPGREQLGIILNLPVAIPNVVVGTSLLLLWGPIGILGKFLEPLGIQPMFTAFGVLLAHIFVTFPYMVGAVKPVLDDLPVTYEEAAYTIGASRRQTFYHVVFPALRGGIITGALLTFAHSLGEFGATVMVSGNLRLQTQTAPLYIFSQFEGGNIAAANSVAAILAVISFFLFSLILYWNRKRESKKAR